MDRQDLTEDEPAAWRLSDPKSYSCQAIVCLMKLQSLHVSTEHRTQRCDLRLRRLLLTVD